MILMMIRKVNGDNQCTVFGHNNDGKDEDNFDNIIVFFEVI